MDQVVLEMADLSPPPQSTFVRADWQLLAACWFPVAIASEVGEAPLKATRTIAAPGA